MFEIRKINEVHGVNPVKKLGTQQIIQVHNRARANHRRALAQGHIRNLKLFIIISVVNVLFMIAAYHNLKNVANFYYHMHVTNQTNIHVQ